jgi:hypothetical protein
MEAVEAFEHVGAKQLTVSPQPLILVSPGSEACLSVGLRKPGNNYHTQFEKRHETQARGRGVQPINPRKLIFFSLRFASRQRNQI